MYLPIRRQITVYGLISNMLCKSFYLTLCTEVLNVFLNSFLLCITDVMYIGACAVTTAVHCISEINRRPISPLNRTQRFRGLRRVPAAVRLLGLRVRIPPGSWMSVSCQCCVLSGRGLCDGPIALPEDSYRVVCLSVIGIIDNEEALAH
jgi:hypothetical protein